MRAILLKNIKTKSEARQIAIDWQNWQSKQSLSYRDIINWVDYFRKVGKKFSLIKEFKENGIL
jgi:RIO-like serine/threonine protein kinase